MRGRLTVDDPVDAKPLGDGRVDRFGEPLAGHAATPFLGRSRWSGAVSPRSMSATMTSVGRNARRSTGIVRSGTASPHMKTSSAAYPRPGQLWVEIGRASCREGGWQYV